MDNKQEKGGNSFSNKIKEGVSVEEIESFTRKYLVEVFLVGAIVIATFFSNIFWSYWFSIGFAGFATIVSLVMNEKILRFEKYVFQFLKKEERSMQITVGVVRLIIAFFLPFVIFGEIGLLAGCAYHYFYKSKSPAENPAHGAEEHHE